jgi:hypothetical protein
MSLDWDVSQVENYEEILDEESGEWTITNGLIWRTLALGIPRITEKNWREVYYRNRVIDVLNGPAVFKFNEDGTKTNEITPSAIKRRIGLSTSVTKLTDKQFASNIGASLLRQEKYIGKHEIERMEKSDETP